MTIQFTVPTADVRPTNEESIVNRDAQAVSLDTLAGAADAQPVPLGLTPGVNAGLA